jgi:hypothetical protein
VRASILVLAIAALPLASCATLANAAKGDENLPNAEAGPFRELRRGELGLSLVAPNAVDDDKMLARDPSILDADGDPTTFEVIGYFAAAANGATADAATIAIRRGTAADGRSFERQTEVVLEATEPWEEGTIGAPSALSASGEVWLFYAGGGGIGLAKSADGIAFTKVKTPVLGPADSGWDAGIVPRSPGVVALPDGGFAMFYEVTSSSGQRVIGEAVSADGEVWSRVGAGPALAPGEPGDEAYDDAGVGAQSAVVGESASGRSLIRLYYSAESGAGKRTIGLAGRFDGGTSFERGTSPVFGAGSARGPREPCAVVFDGVTLLFATQARSRTSDEPAIAAGVAPAQAELPQAAKE